MTAALPSRSLPKLWCDFNACGWSGEAGDNCYYSLHREQIAKLQPTTGMRVFVWDWSDEKLVIGCEALLEPYNDSWRVRPVDGTWFEGLPDDTFAT
jgi:hypothetical protein